MTSNTSRPHTEANSGLPSRAELLNTGRATDSALLHPLSLNSPASIDDVPPILTFNRVREVELPWADVMDAANRENGAPVGNTQVLRRYFETSWWGEEKAEPTAEDLAGVVDDGYLIVLPEALPEGQVSQLSFHCHVRKPGAAGKLTGVAEPIFESVVL